MSRTFICQICNENQVTEWTKEEAIAEAEKRWGPMPEGDPDTNMAVVSVCEDCDRALMKIVKSLGLTGDWDESSNDDLWNRLEIWCIGCHRVPAQIEEYREAVAEQGEKVTLISCVAYVVTEEGTFNAENGHFACTECYTAMGMPTNAGKGWKAP